MTYQVAALYQFAALDDFEALQAPLRALCDASGIKGTLILSPEGINGTVAGTDDAIAALVVELQRGDLFHGRLDHMELKYSSASAMPFRRMKVKLKREIVTLGRPEADPTRRVGTYVDPADWNALIRDPDVLLVDTRNRFEVAMGTFEGAVDPETRKFSQFPDFVRRSLDPARHKRVAMFCTGGIRCEKASAYLLAEGFESVFHLKGGILRYLEQVPPEESLWQGECFVFDERIALGPGLAERAAIEPDQAEPSSEGASEGSSRR